MYIKGGNNNLIDDMKGCFNVLCQTEVFFINNPIIILPIIISIKCYQTEVNICKLYVLPFFFTS